MPTVSSDGLTYTFHIRGDYAFSSPASGVVTATSMKYTFERTLAPAMASPAIAFYSNIVGATAYNSGSASHISGIVAAGDTLTFTLVHLQGEFVTLLALPFACAVPTTLPMTEAAAPVPTAGPYYVSEHVYGDHLVALRNPNYHGPRPSRFDSLEYSYTHTQQEIRQRIEAGTSDYSPDIAAADQGELAQPTVPTALPRGVGFSSGIRIRCPAPPSSP